MSDDVHDVHNPRLILSCGKISCSLKFILVFTQNFPAFFLELCIFSSEYISKCIPYICFDLHCVFFIIVH